jgi:hypothetical protein
VEGRRVVLDANDDLDEGAGGTLANGSYIASAARELSWVPKDVLGRVIQMRTRDSDDSLPDIVLEQGAGPRWRDGSLARRVGWWHLRVRGPFKGFVEGG